MPHFVTQSLAPFVLDRSIALVRRTCQFAEINLVFNRVEVDSDEIKFRGKVSSHLHHDVEIRGVYMGRQFMFRQIAFEKLPALGEGGASAIRGDNREVVVEATGPVIAEEAVIPRRPTAHTSQQLFNDDLWPDETIMPFSGDPTETSLA